MATQSDYKKCAKIVRKSIQSAFGKGQGSAWSMLVPDIRTAVVRSHALGVLHGWADDDRGRAVSEAEFTYFLRVLYAEFDGDME